ncbi:hypothetical protein CRUP_016051 [Coryphaenoides rupestris]|nr:hypothetical protein CRUP_016051 [Coryphaenoides rupestris]
MSSSAENGELARGGAYEVELDQSEAALLEQQQQKQQQQKQQEEEEFEEEEERADQEEEMVQSQTEGQSHVVKNVEEIFHTIEGLMSKLHRLKDMEAAHHQLLKSLREPEEHPGPCPATVARTPSLDRGSRDGNEDELKIQSTGF